MSLTLQYQGRTSDYSKQSRTKTYTYVGTQEQVDAYIQANSPNLNSFQTQPEGSLMKLGSLRKSQLQGPLWNVQVEYTWEKAADEAGTVYDNPEDTAYGELSYTLNSVMFQVPLSAHKDYLMNWDHYLIKKFVGPLDENSSKDVPAFWETDTDGTSASYYPDSYKWINDISEIPEPIWPNGSIASSAPPTDEGDSSSTEGLQADTIHWLVIAAPTKPGVTCWDQCCYTITESSKHTSRDAAGTRVSNKLNKVGRPGSTFGIDVVDWKCDDATVQWSGEYWLATLTWTSSIGGWDEDLYEKVSELGSE